VIGIIGNNNKIHIRRKNFFPPYMKESKKGEKYGSKDIPILRK